MQGSEETDGAQASAASSLSEVLATRQLSDYSDSQISSFINSLSQGISGSRFRSILTYVLKFVELNRSKYEALKTEHARLVEQVNSIRDELNQTQERLPRLATAPTVPAAPALATQSLPPAPVATAAPPTQPLPPASLASAIPPVSQAVPPTLAPSAMGFGWRPNYETEIYGVENGGICQQPTQFKIFTERSQGIYSNDG